MSNKDLARIVVHMSAEVGQLRKDIANANRIVSESSKKMEAASNKAASNMEKRMTAAAKNIGAGFNDVRATVMGAFAAIAGSQGARAVAAAAQQYTAMQNALKATGLEGKALDSTFSSLFQIAQKNGTEMAPLVTLYGRMSTAQQELNASSKEMMQFTEAVSLALKVSGSSTQEASGAMLQLSQAMGGGKIQAEEYNSLIDGARPLLQAVAAGMEEAGGSVSKLTALVKDGKVSSEAFFRAGLAGMPVLEQAAAQMSGTVEQSMNQVKNSFTMLIGELDKTTGASQNAAANLSGVAQAIGQIPSYVDAASQSLAKLQAWLNQVGNNPFWRKLGELAGVDYSAEGIRKNGMIPMGGAMTNRVGDAWETNKTARGGSFADYANTRMGPQLPPPKKISLADYAVPDKEKKGGGGGGGRSEAEERYDQVERYIEQLEKSGRVLQAEFDTLGKSNAERAKAIELARIGTVTDQGQLDRINKQVEANERLRESIESAKRSQKAMGEIANFAGDQIMNVFDDLIDGSGNLTDSIKNIAKSLASAALQAALLGNGPLGNLFGLGSKDGVGGLLGQFVGSITGSPVKAATGGRVIGPGSGTSDSVPALLSNGEFVVNARAAGQHAALLQAINSGQVAKLAAGGFAGPRIPSVVAPAGRGAAPVININNSTGQPVSQSTGPNGEVNIDIGKMVDGALAEQSRGGRGLAARVMRARATRADLRG